MSENLDAQNDLEAESYSKWLKHVSHYFLGGLFYFKQFV